MLTTASGVPYDVRIFAENRAGNGSFCTVSDFGDEESKCMIMRHKV